MKHILITGANSYIGTSFEHYLKTWPDEYQVDTIDMVDGLWREKSFSGYDTVFHVAGIAHIKETKSNSHLYYKINRDLAIETTKKAKDDGVKQFIFLSSMSVYGMTTGVITRDTVPDPKSNYAKSKLQAEDTLKKFVDDRFKIAILRPPMVYGRGCKGNFQSVVALVKKMPVFPRNDNQRSMIYIENLCAFVKLLINNENGGVFFPQNKEYVQTSNMAKLIAKTMGKKIYFSFIAGFFVRLLRILIPTVRKAFGSLIYEDLECFDFCYVQVDFDESILRSI